MIMHIKPGIIVITGTILMVSVSMVQSALSLPTDEVLNVDDETMLFNFTSPNFTEADVLNWIESSDTVREPGQSKVSVVLQKSQLFQRLVIFAMLNPQPNGACFAGANVNVSLADQANANGLELKIRGQGQLRHWKITLKIDDDDEIYSMISYEQFFTLNLDTEKFEDVFLPFDEFKAYYRGDQIVDAPTLDVQKVYKLGVQAYGGVYEEYKQRGTGSVEIDYIKLY